MASMESWQLSRVPPACPRHPAVALERRGSEVRGHWRCPRCRAGYPVRDGIADLAGDSVLTDPAFAAEAAATRARCVRELARVVRPGGRLVLTVHQYSIPRRWSGYAREGAAGGHSGAVRFVHRFDPPELAALLADTVRITRLHGAGLPLPYRYKLSGLSRSLERLLRRVRWARPFGTMLVAVGREPQAETAGRAEPAGILSLVAAMLVAPGACGL